MYVLLIEPVWNRNKTYRDCQSCAGYLLIEPVWNRNWICALSVSDKTTLLIEPVWNRNLSSPCAVPLSLPAFNRTSMELKHSILLNVGQSIVLLIEPVWN